MSSDRPASRALATAIVREARLCGADLAGVAAVADLKRSPSHAIGGLLPSYAGVGTVDGQEGGGHVEWPPEARSAVVLAVRHPEEQPELDWWFGGESRGNTPGNELLIAASDGLAGWLEAEQGVRCWRLAYHIERGGVYMKDAAVLAGLGCIGRNNLLLTPEYGPRLRLRVLLTDSDIPSSGPSEYDPCDGCPEPCRAACPQEAFPGSVYAHADYGVAALPGRDGAFDRRICNRQMTADLAASDHVPVDGRDEPVLRTAYCRACELACIAAER